MLLPGAWVAADSITSHWPLGKGVLLRLREGLRLIVFVAGPVWCFSVAMVSLGWRFVRASFNKTASAASATEESDSVT